MPRRQHSIFNRIRPFHVANYTKNGRTVFADNEDRARFIVQMCAANVGNPGVNLYRKDVEAISEEILQEGRIPPGVVVEKHPPLVDIFSFAVGRDQYHLGLVPCDAGATSRYMQKLNIGYAKYFNAKYGKKGMLFQNRFKGELVHTPEQLAELITYINIRKILDVHEPNWEDQSKEITQSLLEFFENYPFSSFQDLFGGRNSYALSATSKERLSQVLGKDFFIRGTYLQAINTYLERNEEYAFI